MSLYIEHGHSHGHSHSEGTIALPTDTDETPSRPRADSIPSLFQHPAQTRAQVIETAQEYGYGRPADTESGNGFMGAMSPPSGHHRASSVSRHNRKKGSVGSRPKNTRTRSDQATVPAVGTDDIRSPVGEASTPTGSGSTAVEEHDHAHNHKHMAVNASEAEAGYGHDHSHEGHDHSGGGHSHGAHGHSHGSMNMRGVFLHVLGDA